MSGPERLVGRASVGIGSLATKTGLPTWALPAGAAVWLLAMLLWATGAIAGSFAFFLGGLCSAAMATAWVVASVAKGKDGLRAARAGVVVALAVFVPVIFDPHTGDVYNLPKYTLVVVGALAMAGLWVVATVHRRPLPPWRNGLQWVVGSIVAWTAVSAVVGVDTRVSLLGNYGSYDGLYLAAAVGVTMMIVAEAFDVADVRKVLAALAFAGGPVVLLYGLVQLHDVEFHGSKAWDFIHYQKGSFSANIFSTFGNPNHLGGYLAMIFPIVVVLGLGTRRWYWRTASTLVGVILLIELGRTAARGAWVGVIVATLVLAAFMAPELRRKPLAMAGAGGAVFVAAVAGLAAFGHRFLAQPLSSLFQSGGDSSVWQRLQIWKAAVHMALDNPVAGIGPDNFVLVYPRYQSAVWVNRLGPEYLVNGAHNIFMNVLADQGFVGLALFLALLALVVLRSTGAWRRSRAIERDREIGPAAIEQARALRVTTGVVCASIAAYVVQASFNVQQVGLSFTFWLLLGLLAVLTGAAGVPDTLWPARLSSAGQVPDGVTPARPDGPDGPGGAQRPVVPGKVRHSGTFVLFVPWQTALAAALVVVVVVATALGASGPYRADHEFWVAEHGVAEVPASGTSSPAHSEVGPVYFAEMQQASALNPWEPSYPADEAHTYQGLATSSSTAPGAPTVLEDLLRAKQLYAEADARQPLYLQSLLGEAEIYGSLSDLQPAQAKSDLAAAGALAHRLIKDSPRDPTFRTLLKQVIAAEHAKPAKNVPAK